MSTFSDFIYLHLCTHTRVHYTLLFIRIPKIFVYFSDFEPRIILKLFLSTNGVSSPKNYGICSHLCLCFTTS